MNAKYSTYIGVAILAVVLVLSPIIIFLVRNATNTIQVSIVSFRFLHSVGGDAAFSIGSI